MIFGQNVIGFSKPYQATPPTPEKYASTGPRPWGRGRIHTSRVSLDSLTRFNGAAPVGARKDCVIHQGASTGGGFNGAAPVGARKDRSVYLVRDWRQGASTGPRPWGRGRKSLVVVLDMTSGASTGPRPWGRGRHEGGIHRKNFGIVLQRGRARGGAEGAMVSDPLHRPLLLHRGRARGGAEGGIRRAAVSLCGFASTGPRPWGRGRPHGGTDAR